MIYFPFQRINPARIAMMYVMISTWLIMGAWFLQIFLDIRPCDLCLWQRIPHYIVIFGAVLVPLKFIRSTMIMQTLAYFSNVILGFYHSGIERKWWKGLNGCSTPNIENLSIDALHQHLLSVQIIKCDEISWSLFGLSLTNYNLIICLVLAISLIYFIRGYNARPF
jgi:disulfide bond formation protein DsbB